MIVYLAISLLIDSTIEREIDIFTYFVKSIHHEFWDGVIFIPEDVTHRFCYYIFYLSRKSDDIPDILIEASRVAWAELPFLCFLFDTRRSDRRCAHVKSRDSVGCITIIKKKKKKKLSSDSLVRVHRYRWSSDVIDAE